MKERADMRFSIIVVSFNAGTKLKTTVESVLAQDYVDYEIVVQDGCSGDGSPEQLARDERIRIFREKDSGIYDAMNRAIGKTRGEYIIFLNCGDGFYKKEVLSGVNECIEKQPGARIYYGNIYAEAAGSSVASNPKIDAFACYRNVPCHQACFYERELLLEKGFDLRYRVRADYEQFLWSYFRGGARPCYMDMTVASYEGGGFSETAENRKASAGEHREITGMYMTAGQRLWFRLLLFLTLAPLRSRIAENPRLAGGYNKIKRIFYRR